MSKFFAGQSKITKLYYAGTFLLILGVISILFVSWFIPIFAMIGASLFVVAFFPTLYLRIGYLEEKRKEAFFINQAHQKIVL